MTAQLIDGKAIAQKVRDEVALAVAKRTAAGKMQPTLATVLVGDRPDSAAYVALILLLWLRIYPEASHNSLRNPLSGDRSEQL